MAGEAWLRHGHYITKGAVDEEKNAHIANGSEILWSAYQTLAIQAQKIGLFFNEDASHNDNKPY